MTPADIDPAASPFRAPVLTRRQVRDLDRRAVDELGVSSLVLMENAGRGAADVLCSLGVVGPVVVCCGKGNNAGDGFVVARHLELRNHAIRVLAWSKRCQLSPDAAANAAILEKSGVRIDWRLDDDAATTSPGHNDGRLDANLAAALVGAAWAIDALLGTGATGSPRPPIDGVIRQINAARLPVFALDLPSGLDCDTGEAAEPTIRASHTCTFAALKPGLIAPAAAPYVGKLHVTDIGINVGRAPRA